MRLVPASACTIRASIPIEPMSTNGEPFAYARSTRCTRPTRSAARSCSTFRRIPKARAKRFSVPHGACQIGTSAAAALDATRRTAPSPPHTISALIAFRLECNTGSNQCSASPRSVGSSDVFTPSSCRAALICCAYLSARPRPLVGLKRIAILILHGSRRASWLAARGSTRSVAERPFRSRCGYYHSDVRRSLLLHHAIHTRRAHCPNRHRVHVRERDVCAVRTVCTRST